MDNKFLLFDANIAINLSQPLRFSLSEKAYKKLIVADPKLKILRNFSKSRTLICTLHYNKKRDQWSYSFFTSFGVLICVNKAEDEPATMLVTAFEGQPSFKDQNEALTRGRIFALSEGIIVRAILPKVSDKAIFCIKDGQTYEEPKMFDDEDVSDSIGEIVRAMEEDDDDPIVVAPKIISEQMEEKLNLAEQYAKLEHEYETTRALEAERPIYTAFLGAENSSDRTAATLVVGDFDDKVYKEHTQVLIEDAKGNKHKAEIKDVVKPKDGEMGKLEVQFTRQLDFRDFNQSGFIQPDENTVNMDVQLKAIERIRKATARGEHYVKDVFDGRGFNISAGENLAPVDAAIAAQKYPPNESQKAAIKAGINMKNAYLVMGPPGTGKTTVILEWIKYFVREKHWCVLVSSQNNKAVDNVLERIKEENDIDMIRIGSENKVDIGLHDFLFERKIKTLRESIGVHTSEGMNRLIVQMHDWGEVLLAAQKLYPVTEKKVTIWRSLQRTINSELKPSYQNLCNAQVRYQSLTGKIQECETAVNAKCEELKALKQKNTGFGKLYYWFPISERRRELAALCNKLDGLRKMEAEIVVAYNTEYARYASLKASLLTGPYQQFCEERDAALVIEEELKMTLNHPLETSLGLFSAIKERIENDMCRNTSSPYWKTKDFCDSLRTELARAKGVLRLVGEWKAEVLDSQNYSLQNIMLGSVNLVGATCIGVNSQRRFDSLDFDVTIIDEAGQIQIHKALVPMSVSDKLIMLGDHKQIPPSAEQELLDICKDHGISGDFFSKSLFEYMYGIFPDSNKIMLDTQYRMPAEIAATLSKEFYGGKYLSYPANKAGEAIPFLSGKAYVVIDTNDAGNRRFETKKEGAGCYNNLEAEIIAQIVKKLYENKQDMGEVGIISAYKLQVTAIAKRLRPFLGAEVANQVSATLDSFQGQERDIIIYSFTRSSQKPPNKVRIGFLNELRRLNVAMSRPKKTLVMVGDMPFLAGCEYVPPVEDEDNDDENERYQKSEKHFGAFIGKMLSDVEAHGEHISYAEFQHRIGR